MPSVETCRGPVDTADLGVTLMHEHVFLIDREYHGNDPSPPDEDTLIAQAKAKLGEAMARGVQSIVDPTVLGLGRDIHRLARIAQEVDLHIVPATGMYTYHDVPFSFYFRMPGMGKGGGDEMVDYFVRDITEGIGGTDIKAAILKCATDHDGVTPGVERILRCVARAHRETGAPITTHTDTATYRGRDQQRVFREEGVDLSRVVIGHSGDSTDLDYLKELMDAGSFIGMDRFGIHVISPFEDRVNTVVALCEQGYAGQMVLSHDAFCCQNWFPPMIDQFAPQWKMTHIHDDVLPALRERGVSEEQIEQMLVANPKRVFDVQGAY